MQKTIVTFIVFWIFFISGLSQTDFVIAKIEEKPKFEGKGDIEDFRKYIYKNIQHPNPDSINDLNGKYRMVIEFTVDSLGHLIDIIIKQGFSKEYNKAVLKTIKESPLWTPGKRNGIPVNVKFTLPMIFIFPEEK